MTLFPLSSLSEFTVAQMLAGSGGVLQSLVRLLSSQGRTFQHHLPQHWLGNEGWGWVMSFSVIWDGVLQADLSSSLCASHFVTSQQKLMHSAAADPPLCKASCAAESKDSAGIKSSWQHFNHCSCGSDFPACLHLL